MSETVICPACGQRVEWLRHCDRCYAPLSPRPRFEFDPRVAGIGVRALARAVDGVFSALVGFVSLTLAFIVLKVRGTPGEPEDWFHSLSEFSAVTLGFSMVASYVYFTISEWLGAATLGKLVCGLRVVSEDFAPVSLLGAAVRSLGFLVDGLFFGLPAYVSMESSPLRQRLGDRWGGTTVVKRRMYPAASRGALRVTLGLLLGLFVESGIHAYALVGQASEPPDKVLELTQPPSN